MRPMTRIPGLLTSSACLPLLGIALGAPGAGAQEPAAVEAYYRAVGDHFRVPEDEVSILADWNLSPDEMPVLLFLARRGGISADALVALKRSGRGWSELARRYGLDAGAFYVSLGESASAGSLASTWELFQGVPAGRRSEVRLQDEDIVRLVNVSVLSEVMHVPPGRVVAAYDRSGTFVGAYQQLRGM